MTQSNAQRNAQPTTAADILMESIETDKPEPCDIMQYLRDADCSFTIIGFIYNLKKADGPAALTVKCSDGNHFMVFPHYSETVGYGDITGYSVAGYLLSSKELEGIGYQIHKMESKPNSICDLLKGNHPINFTIGK